MNELPQLAEVDSMKSGDYAGDVMPLWQSAAINSATQLNKAIPILLSMEKNTKLIPQIAENTGSTPQILEEIKGGYSARVRCAVSTDAGRHQGHKGTVEHAVAYLGRTI